MTRIVDGSILDAGEDIICHQVNCQAVMGAGLAKALCDKWPDIKKGYMRFCRRHKEPKELLGKYHLVEVESGKFVANIFGQLDYGRNKYRKYTDYVALTNAFDAIRKEQCNKSLAFPFGFGCGLANGDWDVVLGMIHTYFDDMDVVIYKMPELSAADARTSISGDMPKLMSAT